MACLSFGLPITALMPALASSVMVLSVSFWNSSVFRCPLRMYCSVFSHGISIKPHIIDTELIYCESEKANCTLCWAMWGLTRGLP